MQDHGVLVDPPKIGGPDSIGAAALLLDGHPDILIRISTYTNYQTLDPSLLSRV
jgi:hypothetical protein